MIASRERCEVRLADCHAAAAPGKVGRFPRGSGCRQDAPDATQQRPPVGLGGRRTAKEPGKVRRF
ncbi:hypothetical protein LAN16_23650, partial [Mycobacterium tuberculosis]|nr:hypothetical protein [Mycobacterium tuberculosis]